MRAFTVVVLSAAVIPALAAPFNADQIVARNVPAPAAAGAAAGQESGALNLKGIFNGVKKVAGLFLRDENGALVARELEVRDDEFDLLKRAFAQNQESGALNLKGLWNGAKKVAGLFLRDEDGVLVARDSELELRDDEFEHLLRRAAPPTAPTGQESGALNLKGLWNGAKKIAGLFLRDENGALVARELEVRDDEFELLKRAVAQNQESGALNLKGLWNGAKKVAGLFLRDEDGVLVARDSSELELRDDEMHHLLRRATPPPPTGQESGALNLKGLWNGAKKIAGLFLRDENGALVARELEVRDDEFEILKRAVANSQESGALNLKGLWNGAKKVAGLFLRDEDGVLLARNSELEMRDDEAHHLLRRMVGDDMAIQIRSLEELD
ncbi:hypothetical protein ABKN59_001649 [Abortiporus biennis]